MGGLDDGGGGSADALDIPKSPTSPSPHPRMYRDSMMAAEAGIEQNSERENGRESLRKDLSSSRMSGLLADYIPNGAEFSHRNWHSDVVGELPMPSSGPDGIGSRCSIKAELPRRRSGIAQDRDSYARGCHTSGISQRRLYGVYVLKRVYHKDGALGARSSQSLRPRIRIQCSGSDFHSGPLYFRGAHCVRETGGAYRWEGHLCQVYNVRQGSVRLLFGRRRGALRCCHLALQGMFFCHAP